MQLSLAFIVSETFNVIYYAFMHMRNTCMSDVNDRLHATYTTKKKDIATNRRKEKAEEG